jgi:shikimate dehydrogenase
MSRITFGLIGGRLGHSFSAPIHHRLGITDYALYSITKEEVASLLTKREFCGLNVTIPYKEVVMPFCDELTETAKAVGSVNTLVMDENGRLIGDNTDLFGFLYMIKRVGISLAGKKVVILGSGGTAKTAVAAAKKEGAAEIVIVSRSGPVTYDDLPEFSHADILVNTTPVGMYPDVERSPVDLTVFKRLSGVVDVIYNPLQTALLHQAEELGILHTGGLSMLVAQAVRSAEQFMKKQIPDETVEEVLAFLQEEMTNIVLIGMPGSGKSTVGALLAKALGRELIDTDTMVEQKAQMSIPALIAQEGEKYFRDLETEAVSEAAFQTGCVIATGGGAILRPENVRHLRQNGLVFFLERPISALPTEGRPLSGDLCKRKELFAARLPYYLIACDYVIGNAGTAEEAVQKIRRKLHEAFIS